MSIEHLTFHEFRLRLADPFTPSQPGTVVVRVHSENEIQVGEVMLDVSPPQIQTDDPWLRRQMEWKQRLIQKQNIRTVVRRELKKISVTPAVVVRVDSQTSLETLAIVWTSIQAVSTAALSLEVCAEKPREVP